MVATRELYSDVLSTRVDNCVAILAKELARRRGVTISALLKIHEIMFGYNLYL
jgi:hypothetical protein